MSLSSLSSSAPFALEPIEPRLLLSGGGVTAAGQVDPSFANQGVLVDAAAPEAGPVQRMAIDADDGDIVLARSGAGNLYLDRYTASGQPDGTFGVGGHVIVPIAATGPLDLRVLSDDRIEATVASVVVRVLPDGSLDSSLNPTGSQPGVEQAPVPAGAMGPIRRAAIEPDGKIVYTANGDGSNLLSWTDLYIVRLGLDGSLDPTFGQGGVTKANDGFSLTVNAIFVQDDGTIVVAGRGSARSNSNPAIIERFDSSGAFLNQWFGPDEISTVLDARAWAGGQVLFTYQSGGVTSYRLLSADGKTATTLKFDPVRDASGKFAAVVQPLAFGADGSIYAGGSIETPGPISTGGGGTDFAIARFTPTGTLDTTYGNDGLATVSFFSGQSHRVDALALAASGRVIAAGDTDSVQPTLARLLTDTDIPTGILGGGTGGFGSFGGSGGDSGGNTGTGTGTGTSGNSGTGNGGNTQGNAPDTTPPQASLGSAPDLTARGRFYYLTITYTDNTALRAASINAQDIQIVGPGKHNRPRGKVVGTSATADGSGVIVTYAFRSRHGSSWTAADSGVYSIQLVGGQVTDTSGNAAPAATLGTFTVAIPKPAAHGTHGGAKVSSHMFNG
jgi:uncharacterized delta-60 repeat protein